MSYAAFAQAILGRLRRQPFGRKITMPDGTRVDTGVQLLADEFIAAWSNEAISPDEPIEIDGSKLTEAPLKITTPPGVPAIQIVQGGTVVQTVGGTSSVAAAEKTFVGTTNQVNVADGGSSVTFSLPQDIHTGATPSFSSILLTSIQFPRGLMYFHESGTGLPVASSVYRVESEGFTASGPIVLTDNGGAPSLAADHCGIWAQDVTGTIEIKVQDGDGNITTISPHAFQLQEPSEPMAWSFHSERMIDGRRHTIEVDWLRVLRVLERLSGEELVKVAVD